MSIPGRRKNIKIDVEVGISMLGTEQPFLLLQTSYNLIIILPKLRLGWPQAPVKAVSVTALSSPACQSPL